MKKIRFPTLIIAILLLGLPSQLVGQNTDNQEIKILFAGNSYTYYNDMPELVSLLSQNLKRKITVEESVAGGATLEGHWNENKDLKTKTLIESGGYDFVILQDQSLRPIREPSLTLKYGKKLSSFAQKNGSNVLFFMTWARKNNPSTQSTLTETYSEAAKISEAEVIPVGLAWEHALSLNPDIDLYDSDGSHPSKSGSFLTAMIVVSKITGELPKFSEEFPVTKEKFEFFREISKGLFD